MSVLSVVRMEKNSGLLNSTAEFMVHQPSSDS